MCWRDEGRKQEIKPEYVRMHKKHQHAQETNKLEDKIKKADRVAASQPWKLNAPSLWKSTV